MENQSNSKATDVVVRKARRDDIPALVALNRECYPEMATDNIVWAEVHLRSHLRVFPQGQLVAESGGKLVGAASSLIVAMGADPLRPHTWGGVTDSGFFTNHDPNGDTLYGADIYVHPKAQGTGVGAKLYVARRELCKKLNLRRILAGGRLPGYDKHANDFSPEEYAERVLAGDLNDPVLSFQLHQGFQLRGVLKHYLRDRQSRNCASLLEWTNPDYVARKPGLRKVRVSCIQYQMRKVKSFKEFADRVAYFVDIAADYSSDFVLLPELYTLQLLSQTGALSPQEGMKRLADYSPRLRKLMTGLSRRYDLTIIAGSSPVARDGKLYNISDICLPDGTLVEQPKLHITPNEHKWWGITGGNSLQIIETPMAKIGVLICYDVEFPEAARYLTDHGVDIIFVPYCTDNRQGYLRVRYCAQARAVENQIYVATAGTVGNLPDVQNMDINYAVAGVFTPSDFNFARDGIAAEADSNEETVLVCDLDLDDLQEARNFGTVRPLRDRRPDLFHFTSTIAPPEEVVASGVPLGDQPDGTSE